MRSRRRRIAPFTKKPPIVSTCTASGCNDPARSRLPRLRYNQDFHSRDEREREREKGQNRADTRASFCLARDEISLGANIFCMCRKLSARWGCFIHGQPRVSRRMEHNETTATLDKLQTNTFFLLLSNTSCIINNRVLFPFERKKRIIL